MAHGLSTTELDTHLRDIDYPATKNTILQQATRTGANIDLLSGLLALPDRMYQGPRDVKTEFAKQAFSGAGLDCR